MPVTQEQLVYRGGGAVLERFAALRKATAIFEEIDETPARASTALQFDRNGVLRAAGTAQLRASFVDTDADGVRDAFAVDLEGALTQMVEFAIPGGSEAAFESQKFTAPTGIDDHDYGVRVEDGDQLRYSLSGLGFDADSYTLAMWMSPDFDFNDGVARVLCDIRNGSDEVVGRIAKKTDGNVYGRFYDHSGYRC